MVLPSRILPLSRRDRVSGKSHPCFAQFDHNKSHPWMRFALTTTRNFHHPFILSSSFHLTTLTLSPLATSSSILLFSDIPLLSTRYRCIISGSDRNNNPGTCQFHRQVSRRHSLSSSINKQWRLSPTTLRPLQTRRPFSIFRKKVIVVPLVSSRLALKGW